MSDMRKRCVFTNGLKNRFAFAEYDDGVYAVIGPFKDFTHDPEFQDDLTELCRRYNLKHGHLSQKRYDELEADAMSDDRRNLIVGNLPEETVAALQDARMPTDAMSDDALRQFEDALAYVKKLCPKLDEERQLAVAEKAVAALPKHIRKG